MALRLFGGQGGGKLRSCPACERDIAAEATFCPFCYMVIRPEGAADLREHLRGGRIPTDVYLLRKMQVEDPNTGPVVRLPATASIPPPNAEPVVSSPAGPSDLSASQTPELPFPSTLPPSEPQAVISPTPADAAGLPQHPAGTPPPVRTWTGVHSLLRFDEPLPPPTTSVEETPALLAWMLERDPVIPNNTELLDSIHSTTFRNGPAARLGYEEHILLQITDDLLQHPTREALSIHLVILAAAYRRAAGAYHAAVGKGCEGAEAALWQMSSNASRLRVEAWVYRTRHGVLPEMTRPVRPRPSKGSGG